MLGYTVLRDRHFLSSSQPAHDLVCNITNTVREADGWYVIMNSNTEFSPRLVNQRWNALKETTVLLQSYWSLNKCAELLPILFSDVS